MKTINVPDSWNEVTIEKFQEINSIDNDNKNKSLEIISILTDRDVEEIRTYDMQSLNRIVEALGWCNELPEEKEFSKTLTVNGIEYTMVKMSSFSVGEWIDLEGYFENPIDNIHRILGVFFRDNDLPYDTESADKRAEIFRTNVNVGQVYGTVVFFCNIERSCIRTIKVYFQLQIMLQKEKKEKKANRIKKSGWLQRLGLRSGDGTHTYTA